MRFLLALSLCLAAVPALAQEDGRQGFGISGSIQDGDLAVGLPIWASPNLKVEPVVAFSYGSDIGMDLGGGVAFRRYLAPGTTSTYVGGRVVGFFAFPDNDRIDNTVDVLLGVTLGGEHFLHRQFSLGVEAQLNVGFSDDASGRFGNPGGTVVNTGTAAYATFYF